MFHDQLCRVIQEVAPVGDAALGSQIEVDAAMNQAIAEVPIHRRVVAVPIEQRLQLAQIGAESLARDRAVFPTGPRVRLVRRDRERRLAQLPKLCLFGLIADRLAVVALRVESRREALRLSGGALSMSAFVRGSKSHMALAFITWMLSPESKSTAARGCLPMSFCRRGLRRVGSIGL